jgi:hypothetical protein
MTDFHLVRRKSKLWIIMATLISAVILHPSVVFGKKMSYQTCVKVSDGINQRLPMQTNEYTSLATSYCSSEPSLSNNVTLHYIYTVKYEKISYKERREMRHQFCIGEETRLLLESVDAVSLAYSTNAGKQVATILIKEKMCN